MKATGQCKNEVMNQINPVILYQDGIQYLLFHMCHPFPRFAIDTSICWRCPLSDLIVHCGDLPARLCASERRRRATAPQGQQTILCQNDFNHVDGQPTTSFVLTELRTAHTYMGYGKGTLSKDTTVRYVSISASPLLGFL